MTPGLYILGTPIGNLSDISARALETLKGSDLILSEDTRRTAILLDRYGIRRPMLSYHKFNEAARTEEILNRIRAGAAVVLVTDSGMPAVSDPGARIVDACRRRQLAVTAIPGPSAVTTAVALCGFGGSSFYFGGFLTRKEKGRRDVLKELSNLGSAIVLFESPFRILDLLADIEAIMGSRRVFIGRELTKKFEELLWGTAAELRVGLGARSIKGEIVVVIAPPQLTRDSPE